MATRFSNVNIAHMNLKQLRTIAREVAVAPATINNTLTSKATLITAIKAK
jgi:hypothetical protein